MYYSIEVGGQFVVEKQRGESGGGRWTYLKLVPVFLQVCSVSGGSSCVATSWSIKYLEANTAKVAYGSCDGRHVDGGPVGV